MKRLPLVVFLLMPLTDLPAVEAPALEPETRVRIEMPDRRGLDWGAPSVSGFL